MAHSQSKINLLDIKQVDPTVLEERIDTFVADFAPDPEVIDAYRPDKLSLYALGPEICDTYYLGAITTGQMLTLNNFTGYHDDAYERNFELEASPVHNNRQHLRSTLRRFGADAWRTPGTWEKGGFAPHKRYLQDNVDAGMGRSVVLGSVLLANTYNYLPEDSEPIAEMFYPIYSTLFDSETLARKDGVLTDSDVALRLRELGHYDLTEGMLNARFANSYAFCQLETSTLFLLDTGNLGRTRGSRKHAALGLARNNADKLTTNDLNAKLDMHHQLIDVLTSYAERERSGPLHEAFTLMTRTCKLYEQHLVAYMTDFQRIYKALGYEMPQELHDFGKQEDEPPVVPAPAPKPKIPKPARSLPIPAPLEEKPSEAPLFSDGWRPSSKKRKQLGFADLQTAFVHGVANNITGTRLISPLSTEHAQLAVDVLARLSQLASIGDEADGPTKLSKEKHSVQACLTEPAGHLETDKLPVSSIRDMVKWFRDNWQATHHLVMHTWPSGASASNQVFAERRAVVNRLEALLLESE